MGGYALGSILIMLRMLVFILPWLHATTLFPKYVLMELSSFAIWDKNKAVMAISAGVWAINLVNIQTSGCKNFYANSLVTDVILLLIMLAGLLRLRLRRHATASLGLASLLWKQVGNFP